jgi:FdhD protein
MDTRHQIKIKNFTNGLVTEDIQSMPVEYPLTLFINDVEYKTILCTPSQIEALIFGLLKNDFLISCKEDVNSLVIDESKGLIYVELNIDIVNHIAFKNRYITAGCASSALYYETLDAVKLRNVNQSTYVTVRMTEIFIQLSSIERSLSSDMAQASLLNRELTPYIVSDISVEHAVDKVIGHMVLNDITSPGKSLMVSGGITSKTVLKCAKQDIRVILSLSTPTDLAIKLAETFNIILIGLLGCEKGNVYTGIDHVKV